jgi:superfamily II DNA or RNA helicase
MQSDYLHLLAERELRQEVLEIRDPLFFKREKTSIGWLHHLALEKGDWKFVVTHETEDIYKLTHPSGIEFDAELKAGKGVDRGTYAIKGCVWNGKIDSLSFFDGVNLHGIGENGWSLRSAQLGAVHSILAHWSLSGEPATVVLPTGTGKTETMLVTTLVDRASRTLVVVPTKDLKDQLAEKFMSWGMLRRLGVLPASAPNPKVLILDRTVTETSMLDYINAADVVVSTPALLARASESVKSGLRRAFSHVYFDEAHHVVATEWDAIKKLFSESKVVQFTATPYRNDRKPIEGKLIYNYPLSKALDDGCFSPISLVTVDERHPRKKDRAIAEASMARLMDDRKRGFTRHRMMVRAETQPEASALYQSYKDWFPSERIALVHSGISGRKAIIDQIKGGEYDIVVCVDMLKEGFDYPEFKIAAVHGVHKSLAVLLQFIGRFTRTQEGLGDASFVVNYAEERISLELEDLFQEGSGWEHVIKEIADAKKNEAESFLAFLQGCQPYSGFDSPDVLLNPKLVYPALSCVCYNCTEVDWMNFREAFDLKKYSLSQPYFNAGEDVFYFTTQKREKVKWARIKEIRDQTWDLIAMHHDSERRLLYVGYSERQLDVDHLVEKLSGQTSSPLKGDCVFRSFDSIKRLCIVHAGIFKPANHLHRYSRLSGADVTTELEKWKTGGRCDKSDFVGIS